MRIAVFCASAEQIHSVYQESARRLGELIGQRGDCLVYGGTNMGLMREVAEATLANGGEVVGIIPECIFSKGVAAENASRLIVTPDMKERKQLLREHADAFVALPGGWGTLEEITEVVTLKQLRQHNKAVVFLNVAGFYDDFLKFIAKITQEGFVSSAYERLYKVVEGADEAIRYLSDYQGVEVEDKYQFSERIREEEKNR